MGPLARLARLSIFGGRLVDRVFAESGLDRTDFNILAGLRRSGPPFRLTPSELADALLTTRGSMTKRIDQLEGRGLVERLPHPADRRSLLVGLTGTGVGLIDDLVERHVANETRLLSVLGDDEVACLDRVLRTLLAAVGDGAGV